MGGQPTPVGVPSPTPWLADPSIRQEVDELRHRYSRPELSIAESLCDSHPPQAIAFTAIDSEHAKTHLTYGDLADRSRRLATVLRERGIGRDDRVGVLMGKSLQLPVVLLALWRLGAVHVPLFTAFAAPAIDARLSRAGARLVVCDPDHATKVSDLAIAALEAGPRLEVQIAQAAQWEEDVVIGPDGVFIELYTSGTTGQPKGVPVPGFAIASFESYMRYGLALRGDDVYWNAADPGWAYGLYYGIVGPLALGRSNILLGEGFSAERMIRVIDELAVTNLAASPTMYRAVKQAGMGAQHPLRAASSCGEPLTPDVVAWSPDALGVEVRDQWGQTEQGMAIVNAWEERLCRDVLPGSMGQAMPGFTVGTVGQSVALSRSQSPLMWFSGYQDAPSQTRDRYTDDNEWYLTGDVGHVEGSDHFFSARDDDVILAAGYRIAPFDIESILTADDDVAEAAVVGRPDELRGEAIEAFVVLGTESASADLVKRLQDAVRSGYGLHAYPRRVHIVASLPKTPSGKVQRNVLRHLTEDDLIDLTVCDHRRLSES